MGYNLELWKRGSGSLMFAGHCASTQSRGGRFLNRDTRNQKSSNNDQPVPFILSPDNKRTMSLAWYSPSKHKRVSLSSRSCPSGLCSHVQPHVDYIYVCMYVCRFSLDRLLSSYSFCRFLRLSNISIGSRSSLLPTRFL